MSMSRVRAMLEDLFSLGELINLCFDLDAPFDDLAGDSKSGRCRELITWMWQRSRFWDLVGYCERVRPNRPWPVQLE